MYLIYGMLFIVDFCFVGLREKILKFAHLAIFERGIKTEDIEVLRQKKLNK